jgi:hypothetical protein
VIWWMAVAWGSMAAARSRKKVGDREWMCGAEADGTGPDLGLLSLELEPEVRWLMMDWMRDGGLDMVGDISGRRLWL